MNKYLVFKFVTFLISVFAFFSFGYADSPTIKEVSKSPGLDKYTVLTVIGLPFKLENKVIENYKRHFPDVTFVKRKRLTDAVKKEDLIPWRLDGKTRETLKKVFDIEGIIYGQCIDCGTLNVLPALRLGIADIETGELIGYVTTVRIRLDEISEVIYDAIGALK